MRITFLLILTLLDWTAASADDRRERSNDAAKEGDQKSKQQLTPPMVMHFAKAMEHEQKASQAEQKQDFGTANQERQMAQMEQMKGQQLQQQLDANQKSADKN